MMDTSKFAKRVHFLSQQDYLLGRGPGVGSDRNRGLRVLREGLQQLSREEREREQTQANSENTEYPLNLNPALRSLFPLHNDHGCHLLSVSYQALL